MTSAGSLVVAPRRALTALAALASLATAGCATSLSGFQPAHVAPEGHVQVEAGVDGSLPTGTIGTLIDAGKTLATAARSRSLSPDERDRLLDAGINLAVDPPAAIFHAAVAYVPFSSWEVGARYSSGGWRLGGRHQFLSQDSHGFDLSAGLGVGRFDFEFPVQDVLDILELDGFTRWSLDVPVIFGKRGSFYRLWGGPRVMLSRFSAAMRLQLPAAQGAPAQTLAATVDGTGTFVGVQGGVAVGYRHVFLAVELTVVRLYSRANLVIPDRTRDVDIGGLILYPGVALMIEL